ncbi:MAG: DNA polymerase IV [Oscillospiraceae bacterium]|jgi:DNA polymerase-4|nr:DNA polymerase IV [Oscillospiraceae bacterium]
MSATVIFHVDCDAFFASVEALSHPEAAGKPMAVCGAPEKRHGIILAKNQLAKQAGVRTAEPIWQARRKCPGLILLPPHHALYEEYCDRANAIYERFTDRVERAGIDESYLDVTGLYGMSATGAEIADAIREAVRTELGITVSVGASFCRIFAKMGSDLKKPDSTNVITRGNYENLLHPLPVGAMMSVGKVTERKLAGLGIHTVGQLAALGEATLVKLLGKHGATLYRYANGLDDEPVVKTEDLEDVKSVGNSTTFRRDLTSADDIKTGLRALSESVAYRLRKHGKKCCGVQISIKDTALNTIDRQTRLAEPTHLEKPIYEAALELALKSWKAGRPIRMLSVTAINLTDGDGGEQLTLFGDSAEAAKREALARSVDALKRRYGKSVIKPASLLKNDLGIDE